MVGQSVQPRTRTSLIPRSRCDESMAARDVDLLQTGVESEGSLDFHIWGA